MLTWRRHPSGCGRGDGGLDPKQPCLAEHATRLVDRVWRRHLDVSQLVARVQYLALWQYVPRSCRCCIDVHVDAVSIRVYGLEDDRPASCCSGRSHWLQWTR